MSNYAIATFFSFVTAIFTLASSWTKDPHRTYWYQVAQCLVYAIAAYFYGVYPCILMMLINATRNALVASNRYRPVHCAVFSVLALVLGIAINTSGVVGLITVFATVQYSICSYLLRKPIPVKLNVTLNLAIWFCYDILIKDVFSGIMDITGAILAAVTIVRLMRSGEGAEQLEES